MKKEIPSLVIGFCKCANCGWTDNKFNWHTYFKCPECGGREYVKENFWGELEPEEEERSGVRFAVGTTPDVTDSGLYLHGEYGSEVCIIPPLPDVYD